MRSRAYFAAGLLNISSAKYSRVKGRKWVSNNSLKAGPISFSSVFEKKDSSSFPLSGLLSCFSKRKALSGFSESSKMICFSVLLFSWGVWSSASSSAI